MLQFFLQQLLIIKQKNYSKEKIKKSDQQNINLTKNVDIISYVSKHNSLRPKLTIGFAAETENIDENAKKKIK